MDNGSVLFDVADDSAEALLEAYEERGWGDGLPLVAPTEARVQAMLDVLGPVDPDEVIATLPPRFGKATRRIVAVNAVLAGCRPEYLPVLITAVRALGRPEVNLRGVNATTHCVAPLLIVHGEVAADRRVQQRHRSLRSGQPGQRHHRSGPAPGAAPRGRRRARTRAMPRPREGRPNTPTAWPRTWRPRRGRATPSAGASTPPPPSPSIAARHPTTSTTWRATTRPHPGQVRLGDGIHGAEQHDHQPGRVLRGPRP